MTTADNSGETGRSGDPTPEVGATEALSTTRSGGADPPYRRMIESTRDAIVLFDSQCHVVYANRVAAALAGTSPERLIGSDMAAGLPPESADARRRELAFVFETGHPLTVEYEVRTHGRETWQNTQFVPVCDPSGDVELVLGVSRDLTARKRIERAESEMRSRLEFALEATGVGLWSWDAETREGYASAESARILGHGDSGFEFSAQAGAALIHPDDRERVSATLAKNVSGGQPLYELEFRAQPADGSSRWILIRYRVIADARGKLSRLTGTMLNVTDRVKLEQQLRHAQRMEAVGRLAGGIAHDFNNLLTAISSNISLALMDLEPRDPLRDTLLDVAAAAESAASLTARLLAFSRRQIIELRVTDLNQLLEDMQKMLGRLIGEDVELVTSLGEQLGAVRVDRSQIEQVVVNLAVNARDAMPQGGKLVLETFNDVLDPECRARHPELPPGDYVALRVSDTGHGMTDEVKAHLFEPFFTTKEKGKGTGLGLAMVYGAVRQHGGIVDVHSERGKGTSFTIRFPCVRERTDSGRARTPAGDLPGGSETILLVEDDPTVRRVAARILGRLGYRVLAHAGGEQALQAASAFAEEIHLLIADVVMPGMDGRALADTLSVVRPVMKVLFTSGYTEDAIVTRGVLDEGVHFLAKPYTPPTLAGRVREVLDGC